MKRVWWMSLLIILLAALAACGGQAAPEAAAPADTAAASEPAAGEETSATEEEAPAEEAAAEEAPAEEAAADSTTTEGAAEPAAEGSGDLIAGRAASGTDPDTGLEINPPELVAGVDFIVRGEIVNHNLTPTESPEFVVISPAGVRYRIRSQALGDIFFEDGTQPLPHEYRRGMPIQATVRQEEDAGLTTVVHSTDLVLLQDQ